MSQPSASEQYLLELINAERAEAGAQPLAFNGDLNEAAELHSQWMIETDTFSHSGAGGSTPTERMRDAGYSLTGSWATGENIAWATTRSPAGTQDEVALLHTNLMNSSGHRQNLLNDSYREVGLGFETGDYRGRDGAFVTEDFGRTGSSSFLTGVSFDDLDGDRSYDPGEGLGGLTVTATGAAGGRYSTTTWDAGGYALALPAGSYTVTFSGEGIATSTHTVQIAGDNLKLDLVDPALGASEPDPAPEPATPDPVPDDGPDDDGEVVAPAPPPASPSDLDDGPDPAPRWLADFFRNFDDDGGRWGGWGRHREGTRDVTERAGDDANGRDWHGDRLSFDPAVTRTANAERADRPGDDADGAGGQWLDRIEGDHPDWPGMAAHHDGAEGDTGLLAHLSARLGANADLFG